jgi:hypothetical protein
MENVPRTLLCETRYSRGKEETPTELENASIAASLYRILAASHAAVKRKEKSDSNKPFGLSPNPGNAVKLRLGLQDKVVGLTSTLLLNLSPSCCTRIRSILLVLGVKGIDIKL